MVNGKKKYVIELESNEPLHYDADVMKYMIESKVKAWAVNGGADVFVSVVSIKEVK
jgi:phosphotransacetylase